MKMISSVLFAICFALVIIEVSSQEVQDLDNKLYYENVNVQCERGFIINQIRSKFGGKDRKWSFGCTEAPAGGLTNDCEWSQLTPLYYGWSLSCGDPRFFGRDSDMNKALITAVKSFYAGEDRDRRWKIKCCKTFVEFYGGEQERILNYNGEEDSGDGKYKDDGVYFDYTVPDGYIMTELIAGGWMQTLSDRQLVVYYRKYRKCVVDEVKPLEEIEPIETETAVVAVGSVIGCSEDVTYGLKLAQDTSVTESRTFTTAKESTFSWGASVGVSAGVGLKFNGVGGTLSFGYEYSYDGSSTYGEENAKLITQSSGATAAQMVKGEGLHAYLVYATMDKYSFNSDNVASEVTTTCTYYNGGTEPAYKRTFTTEPHPMDFTGRTYSNTHFHVLSAPLEPAQCTQVLSDCIQGIDAHGSDLVGKDRTPDNLETAFKRCLGEDVQVMRRSL